MTVSFTCPRCQTTFSERGGSFPFCSPKCKLVDLGNWLSGRYFIKGPTQDTLTEGQQVTESEPAEDSNFAPGRRKEE